MKTVILMNNLDCAHCAWKMEQNIAKIEGVNSVSINFMMQKMTLDCADDSFDVVVQQIKKVCKKIQPDCSLKI